MKTTILIPIIFCFFNICLTAQTGCTDPQALNYDANAVTNNGNCFYSNASVSPSSSTNLSAAIDETSGLIEWNNFLYTHNDNTDTKIYKLDKLTGAILQDIPLNAILNIDWEEISQDENFIYLGDFGNNYSGNRTNLKIYKIAKTGFETSPQIEIINFSYSNQTDFAAQDSNKTDFDCEAFVVTQNEILLFTKQWLSGKTSIYSLSKTPGTFVANLVTTIDVAGLISGATLKESSRLIALSGYSNRLQPFIFLIYDYNGTNFLTANKRKIEIALPDHQIEAISTTDGLEYNLTNESFNQSPSVNTPQKLHKLSLASYLNDYLGTKNASSFNGKTTVYPNPTEGEIFVKNLLDQNQPYLVLDINGRTVKSGNFFGGKTNIDNLGKGIYFLKIASTKQVYKIIKK